MTDKSDRPFEPKLGRIRSVGSVGAGKKAETYFGKIIRSASRAGCGVRQDRRPRSWSVGPRRYARRVVIKMRYVKLMGRGLKAQGLHLHYIGRESAARDGERGTLYDGVRSDIDGGVWLKAHGEDRHQFRFIVSPEDAPELADLKPFVHDLMARMNKILKHSAIGSRLTITIRSTRTPILFCPAGGTDLIHVGGPIL